MPKYGAESQVLLQLVVATGGGQVVYPVVVVEVDGIRCRALFDPAYTSDPGG